MTVTIVFLLFSHHHLLLHYSPPSPPLAPLKKGSCRFCRENYLKFFSYIWEYPKDLLKEIGGAKGISNVNAVETNMAVIILSETNATVLYGKPFTYDPSLLATQVIKIKRKKWFIFKSKSKESGQTCKSDLIFTEIYSLITYSCFVWMRMIESKIPKLS